jgi:predicted nucleic acid-binding Zn finger protein
VHGKSGQYITLPRHYCSCQAHFYEVVGKADAPYVREQTKGVASGWLPPQGVGSCCMLLQLLQLHGIHLQEILPLPLAGLGHAQARLCMLLAALQCKHQLAARMAMLLGRCTVTSVEDATLATILMQS